MRKKCERQEIPDFLKAIERKSSYSRVHHAKSCIITNKKEDEERGKRYYLFHFITDYRHSVKWLQNFSVKLISSIREIKSRPEMS